ncbi:MAG: FliM/FliN family flagellar motor switch protein [Thermoguttaceae bacterium]
MSTPPNGPSADGLRRQVADGIAQNCKASAAGLGAAISRAFDRQVSVTVGDAKPIDPDSLPEGCRGPGLAIAITIGQTGALVVIPEAARWLPAWCSQPDPQGQQKLGALARQLAALLVPEDSGSAASRAGYVRDLAAAIGQSGLAKGAATVPLRLRQPDGAAIEAAVIWPASRLDGLFGGSQGPAGSPGLASSQRGQTGSSAPEPASTPPGRQGSLLARLPAYTRSLLRIKVPVLVTLARKKQPLGRVLELGPGSIIQFDKSCEEMLELDVGQRPVGLGEAVKVGDKFGLRITSIVLPEERFKPVQPTSP